MGSLAHLEKMGRELKCPICLSLFSSAVSLNCNHVFCNSCIVKSMKSGSNCPVCKIPYQRREVRPAPHMDNLVSIYKSMEDASGINMFMSQTAPSIKSSDGRQQAEDGCDLEEQDHIQLCQHRAEKQRTVKGKKSCKTKSNQKNCDSISVKPSFPTKKRVQVPQCPLSETPTCPKQLSGDIIDEKSKHSTALKEKAVLNEKEEPVLTPFFWLSDKDGENLSQQLSGLNDIPSPKIPTFSDIKDSDDEDTSGLIPLVADTEEIDRTQVKELKEASEKTKLGEEITAEKSRSRKSRVNRRNLFLVPNHPHDGAEGGNHQYTKGDRRTRSITKRKSATNHTDLVEDSIADVKGSGNFYQEQAKESNSSVAKAGKRSKKLQSSVAATKATSESVFAISPAVEKHNECSALKGITELPTSLENSEGSDVAFAHKKAELPTSLEKSEGSDGAFAQKKAKKTRNSVKSRKQKVVAMPIRLEEVLDTKKAANKNTTTELCHNVPKVDSKEVSGVKSKFIKHNKKVKVFPRDAPGIKKVAEIKKQANKNTATELPLGNLPTDNKEVSEISSKFGKRSREVKSCDQELLKSNKKVKVSVNGSSKDDVVIKIEEGHHIVNEKGNQPNEKTIGGSNAGLLTDRSPMQKLPTLKNDVVLSRCDAVESKIHCAFCLSSEESEVSGEIIHYYIGKPVAADHNGGSKVIHSHRNCTEWAPNVYFEDDIAINLEAELTRSRRITCCCCGRKGASLGCYQQTCRKCFHVTCAKMTPECRWDTDNFVMLCPIHASSKLPNEISEARRKKNNPRKQLSADHDKVAVKQDINTTEDQKFSGSSKKLVLCFSTLTDPEREYVAEFERLSGVAVLKKWDSSITHVVAPIDENGACRRTLKVLMGILEGKWILSMEWSKACIEAMKLVNEEPYEINVDIYGIRDGPRLGRLRLQNKEPKLFDGLKFYFIGDFVPSYRGYLQDLVIAAGGTVLHRKPGPESQKVSSGSPSRSFIIYSLELPDQCHPSKKGSIFNQRRADAKSLADSAGANVASNSWILNSIAACKLQSLSE